MKRLILAFQFLTIMPIKKMGNLSVKDVGGSTAFFPAVGGVQGILIVIASALLMRVLPAEVLNGFILLLMIIINGGLHLDGLADTFDAVASRKDKDKRLAIMKDSAVGPFGVIAIVFAILLKYLLLNAVFNMSLETYYLSLFLMPLFSRWLMVTAVFHGRSARQDGLGKTFIENTGMRELLTATFLTLIFFMLALFIIFNAPHLAHLIFYLPLLYIFSLASVWFCGKTVGGMTGDTFGAVSEISEILFLFGVIIWQ